MNAPIAGFPHERAHPKTMVRLESLSKQYGETIALEAVDLDVKQGEFLTLLGPSGSGKTTLLNLVAGMIRPSAGRVWIGGADMTDVPASRRGLGMVFQNYALMPHMSIFENVAFPLRVRRRPEAEIRTRVGQVLDLVQLAHTAARKPRELSGGQQQRVALARCIVYDPAIILMDEPLGALDRKLREQMQFEIKHLHRKLGITILYVTHDQEEALSMSDRIVLLNESRIVQVGTPETLYFKPASEFAARFLGLSNILHATSQDGAMKLATGERVATSDEARPGENVTLLVRPENIHLLRPGDDAAARNRLPGVVVTSTMLGAVVSHYVRLADGTLVIVQELTQAGRAPPQPGAEVTLAWRPSDTLILTRSAQVPRPDPQLDPRIADQT